MHTYTKHTLSTTAFSVINTFFAIILSIIIARTFGPENKGIFALALLLPSLLITTLDFGTGQAAVYYLGNKKIKEDQVNGSILFYWMISSLLALFVGVTVVALFGEKFFNGVPANLLYLSLLIVPIQIGISYGSNILLGKQKIYRYNFVSTVGVIINLSVVVLLFSTHNLTVYTAVISQIFSYLVNSFLLLRSIKRNASTQISFRKDAIKKFLSYGYKVYLGNLTAFFHGRIDVLILNYFMNPYSVGIYSIAVALSEKLWLISKSSSTVLFAKVANEKDDQKNTNFTALVTRNILFITLSAAIILVILSPYIITLMYGKDYLPASLPFQILVIGTVPVAVSRILSNHFSGQGKPELNILLNGLSVVLNVALNLVLIPKYGVLGAALCSMISYSAVAIGALGLYSRITGSKFRDMLIIKREDLNIYRSFIKHFWQDVLKFGRKA